MCETSFERWTESVRARERHTYYMYACVCLPVNGVKVGAVATSLVLRLMCSTHFYRYC